MKNMTTINWICWILVIIGGLNWLLIGLFGLNIVGLIFGTGIIARIIYLLVGLATIWLIVMRAKKQPVP